MEKENQAGACLNARVTRAQAARFRASGRIPPAPLPKKQDQKKVLKENSKRAALDDMNDSTSATAFVQHKKRAVLKDVTNLRCYPKKTKQAASKIPSHVSRVVHSTTEKHLFPADSKSEVAEAEAMTELKSSEVASLIKLDTDIKIHRRVPIKGCSVANPQFVKQSDVTTQPQKLPKRGAN